MNDKSRLYIGRVYRDRDRSRIVSVIGAIRKPRSDEVCIGNKPTRGIAKSTCHKRRGERKREGERDSEDERRKEEGSERKDEERRKKHWHALVPRGHESIRVRP